jgi:hypothetical protein
VERSTWCAANHLQARFPNHGGLTPPALVLRCECLPTKKRVLRCTNAHPVKSAVRQPAVVRDTDAVPRESSIVRRRTNGQRRGAVGVSPPWFVNGVCKCNAMNFRVSRAHARSAFHGGLRPPLLVGPTRVVADARLCFATAFRLPRGAYAPRSWLLHDRSSVENRLLRCTNAHPVNSGGRHPAVARDTDAVPRESSIVRPPTNGQRRGAAGVSPPWICKPRLQWQCDELPCFACACAECIPRGAYAPRSCVAVRMSADEKASFAMHERTFTGAVGVSSWPETVANSAGTLQTRAWCASGRFSMLVAIPPGAEFRNPRYVVCIRTVFDVRRKAPAKKP